MDSETIEHFLHNYFDEIRWVDTNIVVDEITNVYKENGIIKSNNIKKTFNMLSLLTPSLEEVNRLLHLQVSHCDKIEVKLSLMNRLFNRNIFKDIKGDWIITTSSIYDKFFKNRKDINVYIADNFEDLVVVGTKDVGVILHENLESFHIDCEKLKIYQIKKSR